VLPVYLATVRDALIRTDPASQSTDNADFSAPMKWCAIRPSPCPMSEGMSRWSPTGRGRGTEQNHGRRGVRARQVSNPGIPADDQPGAGDQGGQPAKIEIACQDAVVAEASGSGHNQAAVTF
jgi:hypothetical protein